MRFFMIALFFCILVSSTTAQNFQPFKNKYKYQFTYISPYNHNIPGIHAIQVDSAALINTDSVFYFSRLLENVSAHTWRDNFWGNSMVKKTNGDYLFLITNNTQNDTLILKTQESLGSQWNFTLRNTLYTISYDHYKTETVLTNQTDYVKTFIVENVSGFKDSIKISENFGLVYSFSFANEIFPYPVNFNLTYIFNTQLGENKLNYFEYFNYDAGDILVYSPSLDRGKPTDPLYNDVYKVLSKTVSLNGDTITYSFSNCTITGINSGNYSTIQTHCKLMVTAWSVTGTIPYIDLLSFPPNKNTTQFYAYTPNADRVIIEPYIVLEEFASYVFQKELGLEGYFYSGYPDFYDEQYKNTRYIKQLNTDDDCSSITTVLSIKSPQLFNENLAVVPNPFDNAISLNVIDLSEGNYHIRITSTLGVEVYTSEIIISSSNQQIELSNLPALTSGVYFLSLENESQVYSQKIVKQ